MGQPYPLTIERLKEQALQLGFDDLGVTSATIPKADIESYLQWIKAGSQAEMHYMENQMRCDPQAFFPGARTAILFVSYYKQEKVEFQPGRGVIASYARGRDYHRVHRKRLKKFIAWLEQETGQAGIARGFSDSAPLLEKALAAQAGLGWFGKNTLLIHRKFGTFFLLSGILTSLELPATVINTRLARCGSCTRCLDACPTAALVEPYKLEAARCLSYQLIESDQPIPDEIAKKNPGYIFGCDICQDVCPHNARKPLSLHVEFAPESGMGESLSKDDLIRLEQHPEELHGSPLQRRGVDGLIKTFHSK